MGVYYPPHVVLYGLLPTELAYIAEPGASHALGGARGVLGSRVGSGVSAAGSALAGFAFSASGFFVIHMPHPWGYTTGSWMPWAWGLAWWLLNCRSHRCAGRLFSAQPGPRAAAPARALPARLHDPDRHSS